jgi:hypothetical protein
MMRHMTECIINGPFHHLVLKGNEVGTPCAVGTCKVKPQGAGFTGIKDCANSSGGYDGRLIFPQQLWRGRSGDRSIFQN